MKNRNTEFTALLVALAFVLAPLVQAERRPDGGPIRPSNDSASATSEASSADSTSPADNQIITIHSTGKVKRGKIGSFVLQMDPAVLMGGLYVNFKVSGTAVAGVDYLPLISPAYIGASGYAVILVHTLVDSRAQSLRQADSVIVTLEPGPGYALGTARSAKLMIEP